MKQLISRRTFLKASAASGLAAGTASLVGCGDSTVYELRTSTNLAATSTIGQSLDLFVTSITEQSEGRIEAVANYGSELGTQSEQVEMCQTGSLEMVVAAPGTGPGTWVPELMMFEFPYMFEDNAHYRTVLAGMEDEVTARVEEYGFIARAGQSQGARHMLTVTPVQQLSDLQGLTMRGPNSVYTTMFECLGAAATTTDWTEIYTALQTGVIDGMESAPNGIYSMSFHDNAKNLTITNHIIACTYYFFNAEWFNDLPSDLQEIVEECAAAATAHQCAIDDDDQDVALAAMMDDGVVVHEIDDAADWVAACSGMLADYYAMGDNWATFIDAIGEI